MREVRSKQTSRFFHTHRRKERSDSMRTHQQLLDEIKLREELGLPRITLTEEERIMEFGDPDWQNRDPYFREKSLVTMLEQGLPMSMHDKRTAKRYLKQLKEQTAWKHDASFNSEFLGAQPARAGQDY
jgi:hypothetical protein